MNRSTIEKQYNLYKPYYKILLGEVCEMLKEVKKMKMEGLKINIKTIEPRIKKLKSIRDNIDEKGKYKGGQKSSISEIPDIAGVRVVCYCRDDQERLAQFFTNWQELLVRGFDFGKRNNKEREEYKAIHIDLPKAFKIKGEGLKTLTCEIQIRTILQDAWAELDEKHTPKDQRRKEGDPQTLRKSISNILFGCEDLWILAREWEKKIKKRNNQ